MQFARAEGIILASEPAHAIYVAIEEALKCKETGEAKTILFNLCGHGYFDMAAYDAYFGAGRNTGDPAITGEIAAGLGLDAGEVLAAIQDGSFAREWIAENDEGRPRFSRLRRENAEHPIEEVGKELRGMMSFLQDAE